jgi:voltage-gated potassium channel Kch
LLRANGIGTTVLDFDSDRVDLLRKMGLKVYYGDATRPDLLEAAGAHEARLLVLALDSPETTMKLVHTARRHFPELVMMARAFDWPDAHDLLEAGVSHVYRDTLDTSLRLGADALRTLGFRAHQAHRAAQKFRRHDEESLMQLTARRADRKAYLTAVRERIASLEQILQADLQSPPGHADAGWDAEPLRAEYGR